MPVDVRRLLASETWVLGTPAERASAMALWLESWHQVPAASLPNNDRMLAHLSQSKDWAGEREHVMRGWLLCSDGRYYHSVVAEKALESWLEKLLFKISSTTGNATRWDIDLDVADIQRECVRSLDLLRDLAPSSRVFKKKAVVKLLSLGIPPASDADSGSDKQIIRPASAPESSAEHESIPPASDADSGSDPDAILIDRDRDRDRDTKNRKPLSADAEKRARKKSNDDTDPEFEAAWKAFPKREGSNSKQAALGAWRARIREGESGQRLIAAVRAYAAAMTKDGSAGTRYVKQAATFFGPHRHYAEYAPRQDDGSQADLLQEDAKQNGAEWWWPAGFEREWDARNAGVTEKNVKYWRDGRPLIKIPGANVEPWPEGTYERP
ncbi:DUF1376 domain-containing protein [Burkholderia gladioli]|uniref:DUF1376 domain-containing protein n=1 Tax=Burkholderia gladioli TaxID=28095 RepID=UPI00163F61BC|nr:DUF1376 domain-containing protein [Burkholderia gladioli]